jgi:hypothetical protein
MQFISDAELAGQLLAASERNEKISRHIQSARRHLLLMACALLLLACTLTEMQRADIVTVAVVWFVVGYSTRAIVGHMRRMRRRR